MDPQKDMELIDGLLATTEVEAARNIAEDGFYSRYPGKAVFNEFISGLSESQRDVLSKLVVDVAETVLHAALHRFSRMTDYGRFLELNQAYLCRRAGEEWDEIDLV